MGSRKEIMLLVVYQDGYTYKTVAIPCTAQGNLYAEITRHCQFAEWDRVSARIGRAEMCVCNEYNTQDHNSAQNILQHVLTAFFETEALTCSITVITKNRPAPMSRL